MKSALAFRLSISIILSLSALITAYIIILVMPADHWFKYLKLEAESSKNDIYMVSTYQKEINEPLLYNDILFCDFGQGYVRYSSNLSQSVAKASPLRSIIWRYEGRTPSTPAVCEIESQIQIQVPFSIVKSQTIRSLPFVYTP